MTPAALARAAASRLRALDAAHVAALGSERGGPLHARLRIVAARNAGATRALELLEAATLGGAMPQPSRDKRYSDEATTPGEMAALLRAGVACPLEAWAAGLSRWADEVEAGDGEEE